MHRILSVLFVCVLWALSAFAQNVPTPSNMTVTAKLSSGGKQYFEIQFTGGLDSTQHGYYILYRWQGAFPDTSHGTQVARLYSGTAGDPVTVLDSSTAFNPSGYETTFPIVYSYAAQTEEYLKNDSGATYGGYSAMSPFVTGTLDSIYAYMTGQPTSTVYAHIGDTVTYQLTARDRNDQGATFTYSVSSSPDSVAIVSINSATGAFQAIITHYGTARVVATAMDGAGRSASCVFYIAVLHPNDTVSVTLADQATGAALAGGTRYYFRLFTPSSNGSVSPLNSGATGLLSSSGSFAVVFPEGYPAMYLRTAAEGYNAAWLADSAGNQMDLMNGASYTIYLSKAPTHTISGTVTDTTTGKPIAGARMVLIRPMAGYQGIDTMYSDSNGYYSFTYSEGDSLLGTQSIRVFAAIAGTQGYAYNEYTPFLSSLEDHSGVNFGYGTVTHTTAYDTIAVYLVCPQTLNNVIHAETHIIVYKLENSSWHTVDSIITTHGSWNFYVSDGKYIVFASPDSGYLSGYYRDTTYAATWLEADTVTLRVDNPRKAISIILPQDSSIAQQSGGTQIDGTVNTGSGGTLDNTHLLLYQGISGAAGGTQDRLYKTTVTDASGVYSFGNLPAGTYSIYVDPVGQPIYKLTGIVVSGADTVVHQDITDNTVAVAEPPQSIPAMIALAQNYPNPFSGTTNVEFRIPNEELVTLNVYNALGEKVATLAHGKYARGSYVVPFDGSGLEPGVYSYALRINGAVALQRMIVVR